MVQTNNQGNHENHGSDSFLLFKTLVKILHYT